MHFVYKHVHFPQDMNECVLANTTDCLYFEVLKRERGLPPVPYADWSDWSDWSYSWFGTKTKSNSSTYTIAIQHLSMGISAT